ncbi:hypothetical protein BGX38DRAFT_166646 [Terfezia claveryi]|nr:hypothetical protein BGX38DRAFT_166646 [Terfezia claveryi]
MMNEKQGKKAKANDGKAISVDTPMKKEDAKKVKFAKNLEQGPTPSPAAKKEKEHPKKEEKKEYKNEEKKTASSASGPRKVGGVTIDDKTTGSGPQVKAGQKVNMRYVGKLTSGDVFDSNTKGKPFSFTLGKGEVIKGWDIGIAGMQPGGERRITIPADLGYGKKALPGIPANSTLVFDVKLLGIK